MADSRKIGRVSAVVCNYDGEAYLSECLESLRRQAELDEVLLVDDASTDGSVELVRARFPEVEVLRLARNSGPSAARNAGLRAARNRFVLTVDNDVVLADDVLERLRAALEARPDACIAQVRSVLFDEPERVHYDGAWLHYAGLLALRNFYRPLAEAEGQGVLEVDGLIGMCVLMDRDVVLRRGGYDEAFFYLAEDYELAYRLRLTGERLLLVEEALVRHRGGTQGLSFRGGSYPERRAYLHSRNRWRVLGKCTAARTLCVALPGLLLYELVWLLFVLRAGHLRPHLAGKRDWLRTLPALLRERRAVQRRRRVPDRALLRPGPLTLTPTLLARPAARRAAGALDRVLRAWWWLARPFSA